MPRSVIIGLLAVAVLALGISAAWRHFAPSRPAGPPTGAELADPGADVIARAMRDVPVPPADSAEIKSRWHDEVRGIELAGVSDPQRELFVRFANAERCTCGCGYTLAGCKASDMSCEVSGARLEALLDSIRTGRIRSARGLRERPAGAS